MARVIRIETADKFRVLLSEILPHELPPRLTLRSVYDRMSQGRMNDLDRALFTQRGEDSPNAETLPYRFSISRGRRTPRDIYLMHPCYYLEIVDFYHSHATQIISNCSKSSWSLRSPRGIAKRSVTLNDRSAHFGGDDGLAGSTVAFEPFRYFSYSPTEILHKFFDSRDHEILESQFRYCRSVDVQKCFNNIYTHAIAWAVRGKENSKRQADRKAYWNFAGRFDSLMRSMNHGETHGILIGPELSRIFAELIFQVVDCNAKTKRLSDLDDVTDYQVRRYLDDFFIYFNDVSVANRVEDAVREELEIFKLFLNEAKTKTIESPFLSKLSVLKQDLSGLIDDVMDNLGREAPVNRKSRRSRHAMKQIKSCVSRSGCQYEECVSYILTIVQTRLKKSKTETCWRMIQNGICELVGKLVELDCRYQISIKAATISQTLLLKMTSKECSDSQRSTVQQRIADQLGFVAANMLRRDKLPCLPLLVLLIPVSKMDLVHDFHASLAEEIWANSLKQSSHGHPDYLITVSLLWFCGSRSQYDRLRNKIAKACKTFLRSDFAGKERTECVMLAADLACCPFLDDQVRKYFLRRLKCWDCGVDDVAVAFAQCRGESMFFNWDETIPTSAFLIEKQVPRCYA